MRRPGDNIIVGTDTVVVRVTQVIEWMNETGKSVREASNHFEVDERQLYRILHKEGYRTKWTKNPS